MPFVLLFVGIILTVAGVRGKQETLFTLVENDVTGNGNFSHSFEAWIVAILVVGSLGYIKAIRPVANAFLVLVVLILFLSNKGFFTQFMAQLQSSTASVQTPAAPTTTNQSINQSSLSSQGSNLATQGSNLSVGEVSQIANIFEGMS